MDFANIVPYFIKFLDNNIPHDNCTQYSWFNDCDVSHWPCTGHAAALWSMAVTWAKPKPRTRSWSPCWSSVSHTPSSYPMYVCIVCAHSARSRTWFSKQESEPESLKTLRLCHTAFNAWNANTALCKVACESAKWLGHFVVILHVSSSYACIEASTYIQQIVSFPSEKMCFVLYMQIFTLFA